MDFTQRKLKKVAEEEDLMLSLYLENEVLYLESGTEVLIVISSLSCVSMLNAPPEGDYHCTYGFHVRFFVQFSWLG